MSETTTTTTPAASQTTDKIQRLIEELNTIPSIEFTEDAWDEKAPNDYGVVELTGEVTNDYADGKKIAQGFGVTIRSYVSGNSHLWITKVQDVLDSLRIRYKMEPREYLEDIKKVRWTWNARIRRPVVKELTANG